MNPYAKFGLAALAGYVGRRSLQSPYGQRQRRRQRFFQIGSYARATADLAQLPTIEGVPAKDVAAAAKGLVSYGLIVPFTGALQVDPVNFVADTRAKLVRALRDSRQPLYDPAVLEAVRTVPVVYTVTTPKKGKRKQTRTTVRAKQGNRRAAVFTNPPTKGNYITETGVSLAFWSRFSPATKKSRPTKVTAALGAVLAQHRIGYIVGNKRTLLGSSTKTIKGGRVGVLTRVMYMSAADESGIQTCAKRGSCELSCLGWSTGQMVFDTSMLSRIGKTLYWYFSRTAFLDQVQKEIDATKRSKDAQELYRRDPNGQIAFRLNGSSDIKWESPKQGPADGGVLSNGKTIIDNNPDTAYYDYTKYPLSQRSCKINGGPPNYHVVYSFDEKPTALKYAVQYLEKGGNSAVVVGARMSDAAVEALYEIHIAISRLLNNQSGACALPTGESDMTPVLVQVASLRERGSEIATQYGVTKNSAKAGAFHVLFPRDELELQRSQAAAYPRLWKPLQQKFLTAARAAGVLDAEDEQNTYDNLLGRALFDYEKKVYTTHGLEAVPWHESSRQWLLGFDAIDADVTDARFFDPPGTWNVLYAKGPAAWDVSGFVVRVDREGVPYFLEASPDRTARYARRELEGQAARRGHRSTLRYRLPTPHYYFNRR